MKKSKYHWHICDCGRWRCDNQNCNLSIHAKCGQKKAHDFADCVKNRKLIISEPVAPSILLKKFARQRIKNKITDGRFFFHADTFGISETDAAKVLQDFRNLTKTKKQVKVKV